MHTTNQQLSPNAQKIREAGLIMALAFRNHTPREHFRPFPNLSPALFLLRREGIVRLEATLPSIQGPLLEGVRRSADVHFKYNDALDFENEKHADEAQSPGASGAQMKRTKQQGRADRKYGEGQPPDEEQPAYNENSHLITKYQGIVDDIDIPNRPDLVQISLVNNGQKLVRLFPKARLAAIKAVFPGAQIEYQINGSGPCRSSTLSYVGPSRQELLKSPLEKLSDSAIEALDKKRKHP